MKQQRKTRSELLELWGFVLLDADLKTFLRSFSLIVTAVAVGEGFVIEDPFWPEQQERGVVHPPLWPRSFAQDTPEQTCCCLLQQCDHALAKVFVLLRLGSGGKSKLGSRSFSAPGLFLRCRSRGGSS